MPIEGEVWVWLRRLANSVVGKTGKPDRLDTATRMAQISGAGASPQGQSASRRKKIDPIDELMRIVAKARH